MRKVRRHKKRIVAKKTPATQTFVFSRWIIYALPLLLLVFIFLGRYALVERNVLSATSGPIFLARGDEGTSSEENSGSNSTSNSGSSQTTGGENNTGDSTSGGSSSGNSTSTSGSSGGGSTSSTLVSVSNDAKVLCTGPDGKQFKTEYKECVELNNSWNHSTRFTVLSTGESKSTVRPTETPEKKESTKEKTDTESRSEKLKPTETPEVETQSESLKPDEEVEVENDASGGAKLRHGEVEADTKLPVSVNPETNELTVTVNDVPVRVVVLPKQAIQNILERRILTEVENEVVASTSGTTNMVKKAELQEFNGEPVFVVRGVNKKKVFGLFTAAFAKTVFTSAKTGDVVKVDESLINRLLELFSTSV